MTSAIRILYVDDEPDLLNIGKLFLEESGDFTVTTALSASETLRLLEQEKFDAIISDYQMPGMNGIQFLIEVRKCFGSIPFILFTGKSREEVVIQAINSGVDFYIQKGGEPGAQFAELSHKIKSAVERHTTYKALHKSEDKYRRFVETANEGIWAIDEQFVTTYVNERLAEMLGYPVDEILGKTIQHFMFEEELTDHQLKMEQRRVGQQGSYELRFRAKDRKIRTFNVSATPLMGDDNSFKGSFAMLTDITARKYAEEALIRKNEELHAANEQLAAADEKLKTQFEALTKSERITRINEERLLMAQEIGHTASWEYDLVTHKVWGSAEGPRIYGFTPGDGEFSIEDLDACIPDRERVHQALVDLISEGKEFDLECSVIPRDGSAQKMIHSVARLEKDAQGNPLKVMGIIQDITGRKVAENALMRVNQKLNVLSQLTRKDLTSQIFVLNSYLEMAKKHAVGQDQIIASLQKGVHAIRSIHETIEYSKDYQDMGAKPPKWQNVKMTMLLGLSHISIGKVQHSIETENLEIFADPLLEKVCQRLFENSVKHGDHVTRIRVSQTTDSDRATIFFEDDGIGILKEKKEQIFLRSEGSRDSMGSLVFVREILDITSLTIKETGEPGKGARFEIVVPNGAWRITGTGA